MKLKIITIFFILLLLVTGCATEKENSSSVNTSSDETITEPDGIEITEEDNEIMESHDLGTIVDTESEPIPESLVGTWVCVEGLPPALHYYALIINGDGTVQQVTRNNEDVESVSDSRLIYQGNELTLVNEFNASLLTLYYNNDQLLTDGLGADTSILTKE